MRSKGVSKFVTFEEATKFKTADKANDAMMEWLKKFTIASSDKLPYLYVVEEKDLVPTSTLTTANSVSAKKFCIGTLDGLRFLSTDGGLGFVSLSEAAYFETIKEANAALTSWLLKFSKVGIIDWPQFFQVLETRETLVITNLYGKFLTSSCEWGLVEEAMEFETYEEAFKFLHKLSKSFKNLKKLDPRITTVVFVKAY